MAMEEMSALLDKWTSEEGLSWKFAEWTSPLQQHFVTSTDPSQNPYWKCFCDAAKVAGIGLEPEIFPAATDSRFLREMGIRALGFSPMVCMCVCVGAVLKCFRWSNAQMHKCSNAQMHKCTNVQMHKCTNAQMH